MLHSPDGLSSLGNNGPLFVDTDTQTGTNMPIHKPPGTHYAMGEMFHC